MYIIGKVIELNQNAFVYSVQCYDLTIEDAARKLVLTERVLHLDLWTYVWNVLDSSSSPALLVDDDGRNNIVTTTEASSSSRSPVRISSSRTTAIDGGSSSSMRISSSIMRVDSLRNKLLEISIPNTTKDRRGKPIMKTIPLDRPLYDSVDGGVMNNPDNPDNMENEDEIIWDSWIHSYRTLSNNYNPTVTTASKRLSPRLGYRDEDEG